MGQPVWDYWMSLFWTGSCARLSLPGWEKERVSKGERERERERERAIRENTWAFFQRRDGDVKLRVIRTSWLWSNSHVHTEKHRKVYRTYVKEAPCSHFDIYNIKKVIIQRQKQFFHNWIKSLLSEENNVLEHCFKLERWQGPPYINKVNELCCPLRSGCLFFSLFSHKRVRIFQFAWSVKTSLKINPNFFPKIKDCSFKCEKWYSQASSGVQQNSVAVVWSAHT